MLEEAVTTAPSSRLSRRNLLQFAGLAAGAGSVAALAGCAPAEVAEEGPFAVKGTYRFTLICSVTTNQYFVPTQYGAEDACALLGCDYTWAGSAEGKVAEMVSAFDAAVAAVVDGIAVQAVDETAFIEPVQRALDAGIPTIVFNQIIPPGNDFMAYIGIDLYTHGKEAGQQILKYVKPGDNVVGFIGVAGQVGEEARLNGMAEVLTAAGVNFVKAPAAPLLTQAQAAVEAYYLGHPEINFMVVASSQIGTAMTNVIEKHNLQGKVLGGGSGTDQVQLDGVRSGALAFTVDSQPYLQGFLPITELYLYNASGGLVTPTSSNTATKFVTAENVDAYMTQSRFQGTSETPVELPPPAKIQGAAA